MKVVQVSTYDVKGGAARAALRLGCGLNEIGCDSNMYVLGRRSDCSHVTAFNAPAGMAARFRRTWRRQRMARDYRQYRHVRPSGYDLFSDERSEYAETVLEQCPTGDVINLHWVAKFIDYESVLPRLVRVAPVVWTLHDMNVFTGGCHYDDHCGRFAIGCGSCPQLGSSRSNDPSARTWQRKVQLFERIPAERLQVVVPSRWLAAKASRSQILGRFSTTVIPNGVDTSVYAPGNPVSARETLGLPPMGRLVLFVADSIKNRRKGLALLERALNKVSTRQRTILLSVGGGKLDINFGCPHIHLGRVDNDRWLSTVYNAADIFAIASLQDNFPNTVLEAMACGTPVVGFDTGGIPDMVRPGVTGELAAPGSASSLGDAIAGLLADDSKLLKMAANCRKVAVEEYSVELQAKRYMTLYISMKNEE